eukprot:CAMPEP_0184488674 /NCGR_PEP_ID=MMETSP0113_2-20130426/13057_1 /TAXON_ID=91329 /ORGANISM="Norrisiella sphaerica, Strain BC52" /LENGTH=176 /DNA_ID=CAMNT_0026871627 /DNA_START=236 /DNA_END=762 /DNA_ORIENTATION=+
MASESIAISALVSLPLNLVISALVVAYWRGLWYLMDANLFPENKELSAWLSLVIGFGISVLVFLTYHLLRPDQRKQSLKRSPIQWRAIETAFLHMAAAGSVFAWRGSWLLMDFYFFPNDATLSSWGGLLLGAGGLTLLSCFRNTVAPPMISAYDGDPAEVISYPPLPSALSVFFKG